MKGWVYAITNPAMPGLVKVGHTMQDPARRAAELNHTGSPHPYRVEYEGLVPDPRELEGRIHRALSHRKEGKEWFRCSVDDAVVCIRQMTSGAVLHESYSKEIRDRIDAAAREKVRQGLAVAERERREALIKDLDGRVESAIADNARRWRSAVAATAPVLETPKIYLSVIACVFSVLIGFSFLLAWVELMSWKLAVPLCLLTSIFGFAALRVGNRERARLQRVHELALKTLKDEKLSANRSVQDQLRYATVTCFHCESITKFDRCGIIRAGIEKTWRCPKCDAPVPRGKLL